MTVMMDEFGPDDRDDIFVINDEEFEVLPDVDTGDDLEDLAAN